MFQDKGNNAKIAVLVMFEPQSEFWVDRARLKMDYVELTKQFIIYFDKIDKLLAVLGAIFLIFGSDFKLELKSIIINFDKRQIWYFRSIGISLITLAVLPVILSFIFRPVNLKDLVELRDMINATQGQQSAVIQVLTVRTVIIAFMLLKKYITQEFSIQLRKQRQMP